MPDGVMACSNSVADHAVHQLAQQARGLQPVSCSCSKACCTWFWMRARWRRNAPSAASRGIASAGAQRGQRVGDRAAAATSGGLRQGGGAQHGADASVMYRRRNLRQAAAAALSADTVRPTPRAGSTGRGRVQRVASMQRIGLVRRRLGADPRRRCRRTSGSAARGAPATQRARHAFPAMPAARRRAGRPGRARRRAPPRARPRIAPRRPRRPRAGKPQCLSIPSLASCAAAIRGSRSASSASSWKCVAKMVRQRMAECRASRTAQAMARPSSVAVPRPISSTTTRERGPAWCRIAAVSVISTMKVERPRARSSAAPTRREQPVDDADAGGFRRHRQAGLGQHDDQSVLPQKCRLPGHVRAGQQQHAAVGRQIAVVRHEGGLRRRGRLPPPGWRPARIRNPSSSVTTGRHQVPDSASRAADCATSSNASASAQAASASALCQRGADQMARRRCVPRAAARSAASVMRRSRSDRPGAVKRAPFAMPWRRVSSGKARSFSTAAAGPR